MCIYHFCLVFLFLLPLNPAIKVNQFKSMSEVEWAHFFLKIFNFLKIIECKCLFLSVVVEAMRVRVNRRVFF